MHWKVSFIQRCPLFRVSFIRGSTAYTKVVLFVPSSQGSCLKGFTYMYRFIQVHTYMCIHVVHVHVYTCMYSGTSDKGHVCIRAFPMHQLMYIFTSKRGQPLQNGRNDLSQCVRYLEVPLYICMYNVCTHVYMHAQMYLRSSGQLYVLQLLSLTTNHETMMLLGNLQIKMSLEHQAENSTAKIIHGNTCVAERV